LIVHVIHKISVLLYQHNGDDTPQNHYTDYFLLQL